MLIHSDHSKPFIYFGFYNVLYSVNQRCEDVLTCMLKWHRRFTGSVS